MSATAVLPSMIPLVMPSGYELPSSFQEAAQRVWQTADAKLEALTSAHPDQFPLYTTDGRWSVDGEAWTNWCEGFLGGELWILSRRAEASRRARFRAAAEHYSSLIEHRKTDNTVHDLGFLFWSTYRRWLDETGDDAHRQVLVEAGMTTASRFRERGRYLPSFRQPDSLFIDIMMNVHMALYAAQQNGSTEAARAAIEHSLTTRRFLMRGDGSASHEGMFDLETGRFLQQTTQQGYSDDGSWARGQSWALFGFGTVYRFTADRRFLAAAVAAADFYVQQTRDELIPPNDWDEPSPVLRFESSAAAAAAGGLWQLAGLVHDDTRARAYADHAVSTIERLCDSEFLASPDEPWEGILKHGIYHEGKGLGVDESVMWGDYWFLDTVDLMSQFGLDDRT